MSGRVITLSWVIYQVCTAGGGGEGIVPILQKGKARKQEFG